MSVIKVGDFKLGYNELGQKSDSAPLVFLHGVGSDKSVWSEQLEFFGQSRRTVAFDYPGYGESDLPGKELSRGEVARFLLDAMVELEIETAHFCGLSMGGVIALEIYKQKPNKAASLILANTFAKHPEGSAIVERSQKFIAENSMREFAKARVNALLAPQTSEEIRRAVVETMAKIDERTYRWSSLAVWTADYLDLLSKITAPTLVIGGELDQPTPPALSEELAIKIPSAELEIIGAAGHLSNLDQPQIFNETIKKFIEEHEQ